jgi:hypothetical protein
MIEQHSAVMQQEQRQSMEKEMQELEKRALAELQRVKSIEDAEQRFQVCGVGVRRERKCMQELEKRPLAKL